MQDVPVLCRIVLLHSLAGGSFEMAKNDELWKEAKAKCRLNQETIRMAKELGLNPKSLIKNIPSPGQHWKDPVHVWIQELYQKKKSKESARTDAVKKL
jgi:hypothetical protein